MLLKPRHVGVLIGSLRHGSLSRKLAKALIARAPATLDCHIIEIGDLPLYNQDLDSSPPPAWVSFRTELEACDALLFVTPEYNRPMPGCLKNATDVGSRPEGTSLFDGLPAAVVSVSPYSLGGFGANHALRQSFVYLNLAVMQQPEAYIGNVSDVMNAHGAITKKETDDFLKTFMQAFERWTSTAQTAAEDFDTFLARREQISSEYIQGKAAPLIAISTASDPATFFPPNGNPVVGAEKVNAANTMSAKIFGKGSVGRFEVFQSGSSGGLGFWTGIQHADMVMEGKEERLTMQLRTTEVFRIEQGEWKLVHRHADMGNVK
ncbi:NAD(P)H-dependent oxidoreductase [Undibacterium sp. Di26W]|uniref:NAD(P)H-dependent oxidoreductase n=1 Tax=Undibacterium sp. Di26W TaxID=3413035 RepID=UPI003BF1498A